MPWSDVERASFYLCSNGSGCGEASFAMFLGLDPTVAIAGPNCSYDVHDVNDGSLWEVKKLSCGNEIRPGTMGSCDIDGFRDISDQMIEFGKICDRDDLWCLFENVTGNLFDSKNVKKFIDEEVRKIALGEEVSVGRMLGSMKKRTRMKFGLLQAIESVSSIFNVKCRDVNISINDREIRVSVDRVIKFLELIDVSPNDLGLDVDEIDIVKMVLRHPVFGDSSTLETMWNNLTSPGSVFGHVDGIVFVDERGFVVVNRVDYNDYIYFSRISQGKARFKVKGVSFDGQ